MLRKNKKWKGSKEGGSAEEEKQVEVEYGVRKKKERKICKNR